LKITDITIRPSLEPTHEADKVLAYVSVVFDEVFVVHNVRIIAGAEGAFLAMPRRKMSRGELKDVAHPISADFRKEMQELVFLAYHNVTGKTPEEMLPSKPKKETES
jgi:stage V sporulation protein G